jgi:hypothetical protein
MLVSIYFISRDFEVFIFVYWNNDFNKGLHSDKNGKKDCWYSLISLRQVSY